MSTKNRVFNVGASARASDFQALSDIAATADDRAIEIAFPPGTGGGNKSIAPLISGTGSQQIVVVGHDFSVPPANGKVRVLPAHFIAGVLGDPNTIGLAAKLDAFLDSAAFAANSSGSTRTDLLYATISYGQAITASVRQKPTAGGAPVSTTLTIENDMTITVSIVAGVASGNPLASLPADSGAGKLAVYNFGLAAVSIANGFGGGAINQAAITQLWSPATLRAPAALIMGKLGAVGLEVNPTQQNSSNTVPPGHVLFANTPGVSPTPTAGAGAGTTPTISIAGGDTRGSISLTAGTSPSANAVALSMAFTFAFNASSQGGPYGFLTPTNKNAAGSGVWVGTSGSPPNIIATLNVGTVALSAGQVYTWNYLFLE